MTLLQVIATAVRYDGNPENVFLVLANKCVRKPGAKYYGYHWYARQTVIQLVQPMVDAYMVTPDDFAIVEKFENCLMVYCDDFNRFLNFVI